MAYWMQTAQSGEHQVCDRHGKILFRYPPAMEAAATEHVRRLQRGYKAEARSEAIATALARISELTNASESDPKEMERVLKQVRNIADEALA